MTVYFDAIYYYCFVQGFDTTYVTYAQWQLAEDDFQREIERAKSVFENARETSGHDYIEPQEGNYACYIMYTGAALFQNYPPLSKSRATLLGWFCSLY